MQVNKDGTVTVAARIPDLHFYKLREIVDNSPDIKNMSGLIRIIVEDFLAHAQATA